MYEQLLESYPNYAKNDLVLYQLARAYEAEGRIDDSLATLDRLDRASIRSTAQLDEAQFRRGETLFVQKRYRDAERAYAVVLEEGDSSPFYEQALYKHGWSLFKQQQYEESLASFFALLDRQLGTDNDASGDRDPAVLYSAMGRAQQELVDDTFRVLSIGFSYLDGPESISRYFSRHGARPYAFIAYTNLGDLYLEQERYQDAADAYHAFVELDPYHAKAPLLQVEVIEAFKKGEFADLVLEGKENFVETYGPGSPYWQRFTFEQQPEVVAHLKSNVTDLAAYHHARGAEDARLRASTRPPRAGTARTCNRSRTTRTRRKTNFLLAEVLFESGNFRDAAARVRAHGLRLSVPRQRRRGRLRRAARVHEARRASCAAASAPSGTVAASTAPAVRRQLSRRTRKPRPCRPTPPRSCSRSASSAARATSAGKSSPARRPSSRRCSAPRGPSSRIPSSISRTSLPPRPPTCSSLGAVPGGDPQRSEITERIASSIYKQGEQARAAGAARRRRRALLARRRRRRRRRPCARRPSTTRAPR